MDIGVPKEIKDREYRVGLTPASVKALCAAGHAVAVETQAGVGAGFPDDAYERAGASIVADAASAWNREMVVKVKEPLPDEYGFLTSDRILFTYLHLAADKPLTQRLLDSGIAAIAYESVDVNGTFPLLTPMSVIAGRLAIQFGAHFLERHQGGSGTLLGGIPGVQPGLVVVLGGGIVGTEAVRMAIGLGARVQVLDLNVSRLAYLEDLFGSRVELLYSTADAIERTVPQADLLVGAVLLPGKRAPQLVSREIVASMQAGSVIVDVAIDQGGCVETIRTTSHTEPTYLESGVLHYGVPNMPGAVPRTSAQALNNSTLPYTMQLAELGLGALKSNPSLGAGLAVRDGQLVHPAVREMFPDLC